MATIDLSPLKDKGETVPFAALDGIVQAARSEPLLLAELRQRLSALYDAGAYEQKDFEFIYLVYVLTEAAREGNSDEAATTVRTLLDLLVKCSDDDDDGGREFLENALKSLPVNLVGPLVLVLFDEEVDPLEDLVDISLWDLLEPVYADGTDELKTKVRDAARACLTQAHNDASTGIGLQFIAYRLAELKDIDSLDFLVAAEKRIRRKARSKVDEIDANGVKEAIEILRGKKAPYPPDSPKNLRDELEKEHKLYADWYAKPDEPDEHDKFDDLAEDDDFLPEEPPPLPTTRYSQSTLNQLGFDKQTPFINKDKIGRNDPCPCGSGRKYKKCCGSVS